MTELEKNHLIKDKNLETASKYMSLILRHKPEVIGISLDEHGWAEVDELIAGIAETREFNRDILEEIVRTDTGKSGTFHSGRCGVGRSGASGRTLAWNGGEVCEFYRCAGADS